MHISKFKFLEKYKTMTTNILTIVHPIKKVNFKNIKKNTFFILCVAFGENNIESLYICPGQVEVFIIFQN